MSEFGSEARVPQELIDSSEVASGDFDLVPYDRETNEGSIFVRRPDVPFRMYEPVSIKNKQGKMESDWQFSGITMFKPDLVSISRASANGEVQQASIPIEEFKQLNSRELISEDDIARAKLTRVLMGTDTQRHGNAIHNGTIEQFQPVTNNKLFDHIAFGKRTLPDQQELRVMAEQFRDANAEKEKLKVSGCIQILQTAFERAEQQENAGDMRMAKSWLDCFAQYKETLEGIG